MRVTTAPHWLTRPRRHIDRPAGPANPFEAYMLAACVLEGIGVLAGYARPPALTDALPPWGRTMWALLLLAGGTASVVGLYWRWDPIDGVLLKRIGLIAVGGATAAYGIAASFLGVTGLTVAVFNLAFAGACAVRVRQVTTAIRVFRQTVRDRNGGGDGAREPS